MPIAKQTTLPVAEWADLDVPLLQLDTGESYIPIKPLCRALLGSDDDRGQRARIQRDPILSQLSCYLPVQTPGGTQDMLCLAWLGIGRWIDRLSLESVQERYRARLLDIMWGITFAAYEIVSGARTLPNLVTIVPAGRVLATLPEQDARHFLQALAERVGQLEIANRDMRALMLSMAQDAPGTGVCPCCGRSFD